MNSRVTLASATAFTVGTIAWYTHLYGNLPFLEEVHASHLSDEGLHPQAYPWSHKGVLDTFDHARYAPRLFARRPPLTFLQHPERLPGLP